MLDKKKKTHRTPDIIILWSGSPQTEIETEIVYYVPLVTQITPTKLIINPYTSFEIKQTGILKKKKKK